MAYIRKRGKTWYYTVDIGRDPVTGGRRQETKGGFRTKKDAEIAAAKVEADVANGIFVKETRSTFEEYAETWLKMYKLTDAKPSSIRQREYQIQTLNEYFGKLPLPSITKKKYREAILDMCSKLKRNSVVNIHGVARSIFRIALQDGDLKTDPTEFVKVPSSKNKADEVPKYMEKDQLAEFLRLAKHRGMPGDYPFFLLMAYTGMRIGEMCALRWSDIDFEACTISINGTLYNPKDNSGHYEITTPKTPKSKRVIDVDPNVLEELKAWKSVQNTVKMRYRKIYHDQDFVFGRIDAHYGYPCKRRTMELRMDRITKWMDLPTRLTPHSLRHTHTSLLAEAGVSLEAIMDRLGHEDDRVTRTVYLHVTKSLKKEAAEKFSTLMSDVVKM